jgi:hypothetical protein
VVCAEEVTMKMARWLTLIAVLISASSAAAQEYFYEDGMFLGLGAQASFYRRSEGINYGFPHFCDVTFICDPQIFGFSPTKINDVAPSPAVKLGYRFNDDDAITLKGDWSQFSVSRSVTAPDTTGFTSISVDGSKGVFIPVAFGDPTNVGLHWDSDVINAALEYQRRLTKGDLGGLFALLGFKFRYEQENFHAHAVNLGLPGSVVADNYKEMLREFLFGPYGGLKLSLKPDKDSKWTFNFGGNVGWYFQNAFFDAHNRFFNQSHFSQQDHSRNGTLFAGANVNLIYAINRNWFVDGGLEFNWIQAAAGIWNTAKSPANTTAFPPSRINHTQVTTYSPGVKLIYKFN